MAFCHGQGTTDPGGCCYLDGEICPHHFDSTELISWINSLGLNGARRTRALNMAQGVQHACGIALRIIAQDLSMITNRAAFENAWNNHPDYLTDVRPTWEALEQRLGLEPGSFQCSTWKGENGTQCCYAEDETTNAAKAANPHSTAVTIRRAGQR